MPDKFIISILTCLTSVLIMFVTSNLHAMKYLHVKTNSTVISVDIDQDSRFIVAGCSNGQVKIIDAKTGKILKTLGKDRGKSDKYGRFSVDSVVLFADSRHILVTARSESISIWNIKMPKKILEMKYDCELAIAHPAGQYALLFHQTGRVDRLDLKSLKISTYMKDCSFRSIVFSTNGKLFVTSSMKHNKINVWDSRTRKIIMTFNGHEGVPVDDLLFTSYNGSEYIISSARDGVVHFWSLENKKPVHSLKVAGNNTEIVMSPNQRYLCVQSKYLFKYATDRPTKVYLIDMKDKSIVLKHDVDKKSFFGFTFLPNGKQIITSKKDGLYIIEIDSILKK